MPPLPHWAISDWLQAIGVLAAWTTIFGAAIAFTVKFIVGAVFRDKLEPVRQELGTMAAAVGRLDLTLKDHIDYTKENVHALRNAAQTMELSVANLIGDYRELATTLRHMEKTLDRIGGNRAGG